jgi:hypothetical protein
MSPPPTSADPGRARTLYFVTHPDRWPLWPFLPLVRRPPGGEEELGIIYDALHARGLPGLSCAVILTNLFTLPETFEGLLALPREVFDTPEELADAGWSVD